MATEIELDRARSLSLRGETEDALRLGVAHLEGDSLDLGAAYVLASTLLASERPTKVAPALRRLVDAYVRRGDLPSAVASAKLLAEAGEAPNAELSAIASAFGKGSARLADVSPAPPPIPTERGISPALAASSGDALRARAESALADFAESTDPVPQSSKLPVLPLFANLSPAALARLLGAMELRAIDAGADVVREGEVGREAYVLVHGSLEVRRDGEGATKTLAALGPGAIFGEMALVSQASRAATVHTTTPAVLLSIGREALEALATKELAIAVELGAFCRARMIGNLLRHGALLRAVAPAERAALVARFETLTFDPGQTIVAEGAESTGLHLVASGTVAVERSDEDGDTLRIATLGPGDVVGEISLVLRRPANATVTALEPTVAMRLSRDEFQRAIKEHPALLSELYDIASKRDEETRSVVAQQAIDAGDVVLL